MARAGEILVGALEDLQERVAPGVSTEELDQAAERFIRSRGARADVQGLSRLSRLDLRVAQRDGRARHSRAAPAARTATSSRSTSA